MTIKSSILADDDRDTVETLIGIYEEYLEFPQTSLDQFLTYFNEDPILDLTFIPELMTVHPIFGKGK